MPKFELVTDPHHDTEFQYSHYAAKPTQDFVHKFKNKWKITR